MKTRYYRHQDPRRGFKLCQELQIANSQRLTFQSEIEKINKIYHQCADNHSVCFLAQPKENLVLQKVFILLLLPILICYLADNYSYLVSCYIISIFTIGYFVWQYINKISKCRLDFQTASVTLSRKFREIQRQFEKKWPQYHIILMRQWNQFNQTCVQYIEIIKKQKSIQSTSSQNIKIDSIDNKLVED